MKKLFPVLSRDKASSSTSQASNTDIAPNSTNKGIIFSIICIIVSLKNLPH